MLVNKIKIKMGHFWFVLFINVVYFLYTIFIQWKQNTPIYLENLNWFCHQNNAYTYNYKTMHIIQSNLKVPCSTYKHQQDQVCVNMWKNYYCPKERLEINPDYPDLETGLSTLK